MTVADESEGAVHDIGCRACTKSQTCCARISADGPIPRAFLFGKEAEKLRVRLGVRANLVVDVKCGGEVVHVIEATERGCALLGAGRCLIYEHRPLDCQLFPFDVQEDEHGRLVWVLYTSECTLGHARMHEFETARTRLVALAPSEGQLRRYARYGREFLSAVPMLVLGPVEVPVFERAL